MANEPFEFHGSPEELKSIVQGFLTSLFGTLVSCRPHDQLVTVNERCQQRWPAATKKYERRIRDVFVAVYRERLGRHPCKLTGNLNGTFVCEREHLDILDRAIDTIKNEVERRDPPFSHPSLF